MRLHAQSPRVGAPSAGSVTHGFTTAYAASKLLVAGHLGPDAYDDRWFGAYAQAVTQSAIREIFIPNPPTMALMGLPVAWLDPRAARAVWLAASLRARGAMARRGCCSRRVDTAGGRRISLRAPGDPASSHPAATRRTRRSCLPDRRPARVHRRTVYDGMVRSVRVSALLRRLAALGGRRETSRPGGITSSLQTKGS